MSGFTQNSDFTVHFTGVGSTTVPPEGVPAILIHTIPTGTFVRRGFWCVVGGAIVWAYRPNAGINFTQDFQRGCPNTFVQYDPQAQAYSDAGQQTGSGFAFQSYFEFFGSWPDTLTAGTDLNLHAGNTLPPGAYRFYEGLPPGKASFYRATPDPHCLSVPAWAGRFRYIDISIVGTPVSLPPPVGVSKPPKPKTETTSVSLTVAESGRRLRAFVRDSAAGEASHIWSGYNTNPEGGWQDTDAGFTGGSPCIRFDRLSAEGRVWLTYCYGGSGGAAPPSVLSRYSTDEGQTWSESMTIADTGTVPRMVAGRDKRRHYFWIDGGALLGRAWDDTNQPLCDVFTILDTGVDSADFQEDPRTAGGWRLLALVSVGGAVKTYGSDAAGQVFTELT